MHVFAISQKKNSLVRGMEFIALNLVDNALLFALNTYSKFNFLLLVFPILREIWGIIKCSKI